MGRASFVAASLAALVGVSSSTTMQPARALLSAPPSETTATYLVVLRQAPAASYQGGIPGLAATMPATGQRFDAARSAVTAYRSFLLSQQTELLATIGSPSTLYTYTTALDGFAARLTPTQAKTLQGSPGVLRVQADEVVTLDLARARGSADSPAPAPAAFSQEVGGSSKAGGGVVIGVIDTGVWPENPSLAGIPRTLSALDPGYPGFTGTCAVGAHWTSTTCSSKVLAAQFFVSGFGADNVAQSDYLSARDSSGHGTAVAAIAAGNSGVDTRIGGQDFGHISGMAPAAGLSVYKACWTAPDPARDGCDTADTVKAIDSAVEDGVDVLNYSIGGNPSDPGDAVELAFLNAAAAHVFVATSAGNGGPGRGSVQHPSPWVTTVGANTSDVFQGAISLGDGHVVTGAMLSDASVGPARLVYAGDAPAAGASPRRAALCYAGSLDAAKVAEAIVVCDRGVTPRVSKSASVYQSGGRAMVLVNTESGSIDADAHRVPTVHLNRLAGAQVKAYVAKTGANATGRLVAGAGNQPPVPAVAGFSGRGPAQSWGGDLLKPDLTAPGVSVVSAVSPASSAGQLWDVLSGTSIATPHVSGAAALVRAAHPAWSPSAVKSALMTTALPLQGVGSAMERGSGELGSGALDPGLVYDSGVQDWRQLLRGEGIALRGRRTHEALTPDSLNLASISVGDLVGPESVSRTVTNVATSAVIYTATVEHLHGVAASVRPSSISLAPGHSATFTVTFSAKRSATYDAFTTGSLIWADQTGRRVTSPVTVRPELARVPAEVTGSSASGSATIRASAGVTGTIHVRSSGLVGSIPSRFTLRPQTFDPRQPASSDGTALQTTTVPPGSRAARFEVSAGNAADDVDLYVYRDGALVGSATGPGGFETVTLSSPAPGSYDVYVTAHRAANGTSTMATLTSWVLPRSATTTLDLDRRSIGVSGGKRFTVTASWSDVSPTRRWWGYVGYRGLPHVTYLTIN